MRRPAALAAGFGIAKDVSLRSATAKNQRGLRGLQAMLRDWKSAQRFMKTKPKIGTTCEKQFVVEPAHAIDFADDRMPAVLCTPWLIWFLEHTAREAVLPCLESSESTVGTNIEISHLAPTPVGGKVTCSARIVHVEGARISFQLEARDEHERIAKGFHTLQIILADRFASRVQRKKK